MSNLSTGFRPTSVFLKYSILIGLVLYSIYFSFHLSSLEISLLSTSSTSSSIATIGMSASDSKLQSDITHITHDPNQALITVYLKDLSNGSSTSDNVKETTVVDTVRQCLNPIIRGRLSGPALSIIQWTPHYTNDTTTDTDTNPTELVVEKIVGRYNVPSMGRYYIEIIGILCNSRFHIKNDNFKNQCLIQPYHHRLTANGAYIEINNDTDINMFKNQTFASIISNGGRSDVHAPILGYWKVRKEPNEMKDDSTNNSQQQQEEKPLFTRYQPPLCRGDENKTLPHCMGRMERTRYKPYQFEFHPEVKSRIETSLASLSPSPMTPSAAAAATSDEGNTTNIAMAKTTVCLVGFSHSRDMAPVMNDVLSDQKSNIQINWVPTQFPNELHDIDYFNDMHKKYNCTHVLIGLGQWAAYRSYLFDRYERDVEYAMMIAVQAREEFGLQIFFRSIHYNPMGDVFSSCPPQDWRYPPVIDGYNSIIQSLCDQYNFPFLDTNAIVGPMWDSADDWCHLSLQVAWPEAFYLLGQMMLLDI